jgi:hypothetical protein
VQQLLASARSNKFEAMKRVRLVPHDSTDSRESIEMDELSDDEDDDDEEVFIGRPAKDAAKAKDKAKAAKAKNGDANGDAAASKPLMRKKRKVSAP